GYDAESVANAMTLATAVTPSIGLMKAFLEGSLAKDLFQGFSNGAAITALEMVAHGMTGPRDVHDHFVAFVPDYEPTLLTRGLGTEYLISSGGLHFKLHQSAGMTQSAADAIIDALE